MPSLHEPFGETWRVAEDGVRVVAARCRCPTPLIVDEGDGETGCLLCGRPPSVRLSLRGSQIASNGSNGAAPTVFSPRSAATAPTGTVAITGTLIDDHRVLPRRRRDRAPTLSLVELGRLVEQFPQIDWTPAVEAAAREERRRAAAYSR